MEHRSEPFQKIYMLSQKHSIALNEKEIHKILNILDSLPDVRHRKIAKIKRAIENGKYQVPAEKVASAMLKDSLCIWGLFGVRKLNH
ncbi:MAG: flagellar biosynthesis anti-sigma factor FlgM [Deltaproteobacteria bacterium]|nr:flagellar biosynthesis anti-sigma factor FlgM [Deltaproteobacteria bacterium]